MKKSNKDVRGRVFRYRPEDYASVNYQQIKQIAMNIALEHLNKLSGTMLNITMMAYMDIMTDIKESHPMIDKKVIDPDVFRDKVEKYLNDYDCGEFNADQVKAYVGKHRIGKVFHNG